MRLARIRFGSTARAAIVEHEVVRVLDAEVSTVELLSGTPEERGRLAARTDAELPLEEADFLAPVQPPTIRDFSVFEQHIEGVIKDRDPRAQVPPIWYESPFCYFTNPHALTGPGDEKAVPPGCQRLDLELEVAAVIGAAGSNLSPGEAERHIAGYTIFNDWSARDLQGTEMQLGLGVCKGKDFANTLGPWIVTSDELEAYRDGDRLDLELRAEINGRSLGVDTLANMAWSFPELVSYASRGTRVVPGDVLGSGTCGNGCLLELWGRNGADSIDPLTPGDVVSLSVEGIGVLSNTVVPGVVLQPLPPRAPGQRVERVSDRVVLTVDAVRPSGLRGAGPGRPVTAGRDSV